MARILTRILCFAIFLIANLNAEPLTLESALTKSRAHYPLHKNKELLQRAQDLELTHLNISYAPRIKLSAKATYQSDVTALPFSAQSLSQIIGRNIDSTNR